MSYLWCPSFFCFIILIEFSFNIVTVVGGFQCDPNTIHLQCQECGGMMPSHTGLGVPQYCKSSMCDLTNE